MAQRGRKGSKTPLSLVDIDAVQRPKPPEDLSPAAQALWGDITSRFRADWFQGSEPLLKCYVNSVQLLISLDSELAAIDPRSDRYPRLLRTYQGMVSTLIRTARSLRMTPQSTRDRATTRLVPVGPRPWERFRSESEPDDGAA